MYIFKQLLPGLKSFCIYAAVGIVAVFIFQVTLFVACLAIDQKRLEERRNAFFYCIQYRAQDFVPNLWSQQSYLQLFFEKIMAKAIFSKVGKVSGLEQTGLICNAIEL
jgi:Niemann-Pick C1 protein